MTDLDAEVAQPLQADTSATFESICEQRGQELVGADIGRSRRRRAHIAVEVVDAIRFPVELIHGLGDWRQQVEITRALAHEPGGIGVGKVVHDQRDGAVPLQHIRVHQIAANLDSGGTGKPDFDSGTVCPVGQHRVVENPGIGEAV